MSQFSQQRLITVLVKVSERKQPKGFIQKELTRTRLATLHNQALPRGRDVGDHSH